MKITMIGHSTVFIETAGQRILTDPYFGAWGNPGYRRIAPPALTREESANVDLVLVSHNHFDHTDPRFFRSLPNTIPVFTPRIAGWITRLKGAKNVTQLGKWKQRQFGDIRVTAVPAAHITMTNGFVIEAEGKAIYFAGDTYFRPFMQEIGNRFKLDAALIPVTTYRIPMTMGEAGAVKAVEALVPKIVIPIHLGIEPRAPFLRTKESPEGFRDRLRGAGLKTEVRILHEGKSCDL